MNWLGEYKGSTWSILGENTFLGLTTLVLGGLPRRVYTDSELRTTAPAPWEDRVDIRAIKKIPTFAEAATQRAASGDSWLSSTRRAQNNLLAWFLIAEDKQQRLVAKDVAPLMHQLSLVDHILADPHFNRVLIGDEVGLGKTVEAGYIVQQIHRLQPHLRILYLAPARLVRNVAEEFRKLGIEPRIWVSGSDADAQIAGDRVVIASTQKASLGPNSAKVKDAGPWDVVVVDECHHLSDWAQGGGSANAGYRLVRDLVKAQRPGAGRLILMSGTPHQGNQTRFENLIDLLRWDEESLEEVAGRVIYRTKETIRDWNGRPLFPKRDVRSPRPAPLGPEWAAWYQQVGELYDSHAGGTRSAARAGGWAKGQALQWVASSVEAGIGFLVRLSIRRLNWKPDSHPALREALTILRPYRDGSPDEPIEKLYERLVQQIGSSKEQEDDEDLGAAEEAWQPDGTLLSSLLFQGIELYHNNADAAKWQVMDDLLREAGNEKVVLFCQPVETVGVIARHIEETFGQRPSIIIGGQEEAERQKEIRRFRDPNGSQFLVSSKAGGEGLNLQVSRRLIHLDVPWNPMDMEQRVGRVHRFGSRQTIIVDTVVVPGTREADAYRIARDKLRVIAGQLADPKDFETLFSRVMNLVSPEELATIVSSDTPWAPGDETDRQIQNIVTSGYQKLTRFTETYSEGARKVSSLEAGAADWGDFRNFLTHACGAQTSPPASKPIFSEVGADVIVSEASVETLEVFGSRYVCDETDGLPCIDANGNTVERLGLNSLLVLPKVRQDFLSQPEDLLGAVRLKSPSWLPAGNREAIVLFIATQRLDLGTQHTVDREVSLRGFTLIENKLIEIENSTLHDAVTQLLGAERQMRPSINPDSIHHLELQVQELCRQMIDGQPIPTSIWPAGLFLVSSA